MTTRPLASNKANQTILVKKNCFYYCKKNNDKSEIFTKLSDDDATKHKVNIAISFIETRLF